MEPLLVPAPHLASTREEWPSSGTPGVPQDVAEGGEEINRELGGLYTYIYTYVYIYMYIYIHIHVYIQYIYTDIYIYIVCVRE